MANAVAVVTESGFGKTTSLGQIPELGIEGLNPKETFLINVKSKPLPFRGWKNYYIPVDITKGPPVTGNYLGSSNPYDVIKVMQYVSANRPDIKNLVVDDYQYLMSEEYMANALKSGFDKFNKLAKNAYDVINTGISAREDINFFLLTHAEAIENNFETTYKIKTIGKMLDSKVTLEGLFTIVLYGKQTWDEKERKVTKQFVTNFDGQFPAKSPVGMFPETYILNDLGKVAKAIHHYNHGTEEPKTESK
jgi:hypothetical protein